MRTTIELPDDLLAQAKIRAAVSGVSLKQFFIEAIEQRLAPEVKKTRRTPPAVGGPKCAPIGILTPEQTDEAMFG